MNKRSSFVGQILFIFALMLFARGVFASTHKDKLNMTLFLYSQVLYDYIEKNESVWSGKVAEKAYYVHFLKRWQQLLETDTFTDSKDIFLAIKNENDYFNKGYRYWGGIHREVDYKEKNLGYTHAAALKIFLKAENVASKTQRSLDQLEGAYLFLTVNGRFYGATKRIASVFKYDVDKNVAGKAKFILNDLSRLKRWHIASEFKELIAFGIHKGGAKFILPLTDKISKTLGLLGRHANSLKNIIVNRFSRLSLASKTVIISGAIHAPFLAEIEDKVAEDSEGTDSRENQSKVDTFVASMVNKSSLDFSWLKNISIPKSLSMISLMPLEDLVRSGVDFLDNDQEENFSYYDFFLQMEKHHGLDGKTKDDLSTFSLATHKLRSVVSAVSELEWDDYNGYASVDSVQQIMATWGMTEYRRDVPALTPLALQRGGNCVSRTMMYIGALWKLQDKLPENEQLGIQVYADHITAVLYNKKESRVLDLVGSQASYEIKAPILSPKYLIYAALNKLDISTHKVLADFIIHPGKKMEFIPSIPSGSWLEQLRAKIFYKSIFNFENITNEVYSEDFPPETAVSKFTTISATLKNTSLNGVRNYIEDKISGGMEIILEEEKNTWKVSRGYFSRKKVFVSNLETYEYLKNLSGRNEIIEAVRQIVWDEFYDTINHPLVDTYIEFLKDPSIMVTDDEITQMMPLIGRYKEMIKLSDIDCDFLFIDCESSTNHQFFHPGILVSINSQYKNFINARISSALRFEAKDMDKLLTVFIKASTIKKKFMLTHLIYAFGFYNKDMKKLLKTKTIDKKISHELERKSVNLISTTNRITVPIYSDIDDSDIYQNVRQEYDSVSKINDNSIDLESAFLLSIEHMTDFYNLLSNEIYLDYLEKNMKRLKLTKFDIKNLLMGTTERKIIAREEISGLIAFEEFNLDTFNSRKKIAEKRRERDENLFFEFISKDENEIECDRDITAIAIISYSQNVEKMIERFGVEIFKRVPIPEMLTHEWVLNNMPEDCHFPHEW